MRRSIPPRLATRLFRALLSPSAREEVLVDLEHFWHRRCADKGRRSADRWYWSQLFRTVIPAFMHDRIASRAGANRGVEGTMDSVKKDIGYALTQLRKHPGVGAVVVGTLTLGIGATTAIFSAVHGVLIEPLPFEEPDQLVMITARTDGSDLPRFVSGPDFLEMAERMTTLRGTAGFMETTVGPMTEVDRPEHIVTTPVSWNLFALLGVNMGLGRSFSTDDAIPIDVDVADPPPVAAVISHDFWQRSFGGDPSVIGTVVHVWGGATEIVGVLPEGFKLVVPPELNIPPDGDMWRAIRWDIASWSREWESLRTVARLTPGAPIRQAQVEIDAFAQEQRARLEHHATVGTEYRVRGLVEAASAPMRGPLLLLLGAVGLVLIIACTNVANLLLARGAARIDEMAVRTSLGAGRTRLVRQLLTESAVLAALGAVGGIVVAQGGLWLIQAIRPADLHRLADLRLDVPVMLFALAIAIASTLVAGLLPALQTAGAGVAQSLQSRGSLGRGHRARDMLVVGEVTLSVVLLVGAALLIRSFGELQQMPLGFEPDRVMTVTATQSSRPQEERQAYERELIEAAAAVPGVVSAGIVFPLPMNGLYDRSAEYAMNGTEHEAGSWITAYFRTVNPTYFDAIGLELRRGRHFVESDENYDAPIVIIDERLAAREFGPTDPVGEPLWVRGMAGDTLRATIVGVVEYAPQGDHRDLRPTMYFPRVFYQSHEVSVVARFASGAAGGGVRLGNAVRAVDPAFPADVVPMQSYVSDRLARSRFLLVLMQIFGGLALGLTAVGLYGVLSYAVRQRTRELGLRLALGARGGVLTGAVLASGLRLAGIGVALGLAGAVILGRALRAQLFEVGPTDPLAFGSAATLVLVVAALASLLPATRAARVDPAVALHDG